MKDQHLPFGEHHTGEYALVVAILLALAHLLGPWIRRGFSNHVQQVVSFGGGLAVAYVFLQLIPEIEEAHAYLGDVMHFLVLFSFLGFYAVEVRFISRGVQDGDPEEIEAGEKRAFWLHVALSWFYTWMVVFALPADVSESLMVAILAGLAIGLHVTYKGFVLHGHDVREYERRGRYVLILAPLLGWLAHIIVQPSEAVFDVFIAVLAGYLMQNVFREELPSHDFARFRWMIAGALILLVLILISP
jgi:uncharacterized membrane protein YeaQ/YmgE (transglycosylase-associated protein family)